MTGDTKIRTEAEAVNDPLFIFIIETMDRWLDGEPVWPFEKFLKEWGPEFENYHRTMFRKTHLSELREHLNKSFLIHQLREEWIKRFGFAIPCAELLDELAKTKHVIEVGAGSGYMTRLMRHRGINVTGSDRGSDQHFFTIGLFDDQQVRAEAKTIVRRYPESTVFCSWPTYSETWFHQMLKAMQIGQRLIVIREGACANEAAWNYIDDCFVEETFINIPTFMFMGDYAASYVKKRQKAVTT